MKKVVEKKNIEIIFKNDKESANKLMNFIINKVLDNYEMFKVVINEVEYSNHRKNGGKDVR